MFKIKKDHQYTWPVKVAEPTDAGKTVTHTFDATFKLLSSHRIEELLNEGGDKALLAEAVVGWADIQDAGGSPLPFSPENLAALCDIDYVRLAIVNAYTTSSLGKEAKRKN